jgi:hypothetical protein
MVVRSASHPGREAPRYAASPHSWASGKRRSRSLAFVIVAVSLASQACTEPTFSDAGAAPEPAESDATDGDAPERDGTEGDGGSPELDGTTSAGGAMDSALGEATDAAGSDAAVSLPALMDATSLAESGAASDATLDGPSGPAVADAGLPAWAEPLIGSYARRSVTFSYDELLKPRPGNTRNVEYSILTIAKRDAELELSIQLCEYNVSVEGSATAPLFFKHPSRIPPLKGKIVLGASSTFESEPMVHHLGFDPARGSTCGASGRRERYPEQSWITGSTCQCLSSVMPGSINDCRVTDTDADGLPGLTLRNDLGTLALDVSIAFDYSLTFREGQVKANRRHELREVRMQTAACINAAVDACDLGYNELCPGGSTRLLPLPGEATCADLKPGDFGPLDGFPATVDCRGQAR